MDRLAKLGLVSLVLFIPLGVSDIVLLEIEVFVAGLVLAGLVGRPVEVD